MAAAWPSQVQNASVDTATLMLVQVDYSFIFEMGLLASAPEISSIHRNCLLRVAQDC
jgi:hypothetical protein